VQTLNHDSGTISIQAPPDVVFGLVSDIHQMARFSPELISCRWLDGAQGPRIGARFEATNQVPGHRPWKNRPTVIAYEPNRRFAISRREPFAGELVWTYHLDPEEGGTRLTETYEVTKPISRLGWLIIERGFGGTDRQSDLRQGIDQTLSAIKRAAESEQ
jgi:hypothetical protein